MDNGGNETSPKCAVICWGKVPSQLKKLMIDLRNVMEPNTFPKLRV